MAVRSGRAGRPPVRSRGSIDDARGQDSIYPRLHGLYWLCCNLVGQQPLALLIDDAQWADEPSLLAGLDEGTAIDAAAAMRTGNLLGDQAGLTFAHPIIRAAIYQSVLPAERMIRHAQAARLLYERTAPAEQVAAQILLAGDLSEPWVLEQLRLAAAAAMALGAPRNAVAYLRRALELEPERSDRAGLLTALGHAEALGGLGAASDHLQQAVDLTSEPAARARVAIALAELLRFTGNAAARGPVAVRDRTGRGSAAR